MNWLNDETLAVGYECGLLEIIDTDSRTIIASTKYDKPITGVCGKENARGTFSLYVQLKGGDLISTCVSEGEWVRVWSDACNTAISFAKPLLINGGDHIVYVRSGQHKVAFVGAKDGKLVREVDLTSSPGTKGIVTASCIRGANVLFLTESGAIVETDGTGANAVTIHVCFPKDPKHESIIPSATASMVDDSVLVGFSNGMVTSVSGEKTYLSSKGGIAIIRSLPRTSQAVIGTWKGTLYLMRDEIVTEVRTPHACNICQISVSLNGTNVAVASTDGRVSVWNLL